MGKINPQYTEHLIERLKWEGKIVMVAKDGSPLFPYVIFEKGDIDFKKFKK